MDDKFMYRSSKAGEWMFKFIYRSSEADEWMFKFIK